MRLLLAEDDEMLGRATCAYLMAEGHAVDWVTNGNKLLELTGRFRYDCIMLDLGLPELTGTDCLVNLRSRSDDTPIIVTTAQGMRDQRIALLDLGADDYLVKPYDLTELAMRVSAIVRRSASVGGANADELSVGELCLRPQSNSVVWRGRAVELTAREFRILEVLVQRRSRVVPRDQLHLEVYGWEDTAGTTAIEVHVHNLRRKLAPELVQTVRGVGYQIGSI